MELKRTYINVNNHKVYENIFKDNFVKIALFSNKYTNDYSLALDVAQESFVRLWETKNVFSSYDKIMSFLYTVAKNLCLDYIKHKSIVDKHSLICDEDEATYINNVIEQETYSIIHNAINSLSSQSKRIINLSLDGFSNIEISKQMAISVNTVKTLKKNAYKKLRLFFIRNITLLCVLLKKIKTHSL